MASVAPAAQGLACSTSGCCSAPVRSIPGRSTPTASFAAAVARCARAPPRRRDSKVRAVSAPEECNEEECAPTKEVGKISLEWVAEEKTKVTGTYPPMRRAYTGYVEKDTAGQTNVYAVEPTVYVADSAVSSGTAGNSAEGADNTAAISVGLGLIAIAGAATVLLNVGKNAPVPETTYSGPPLSYYIEKFKSPISVEAAAPALEAPDVVSVSETTLLEAPATVDSPEAEEIPAPVESSVAVESAPPAEATPQVQASEATPQVESSVAVESAPPAEATPQVESSVAVESAPPAEATSQVQASEAAPQVEVSAAQDNLTEEPPIEESPAGALPVSESAAPEDASPTTEAPSEATVE